MDKPVIGNWYEGKRGNPRKVVGLLPRLGMYEVKYKTPAGSTGFAWYKVWDRWVIKDLGPELPPQPELDKEQLARDHAAFPLLVKVAEAVNASPCCLFDEFEWAEVHQMAVAALAAARPKKEKTP